MNEEFKISKKHIIACCIVIVLCIGSFCAGRYIRFGRITGTSQQLIDGIVLSRETADQLANELNIARASLKSSENYGRTILEGIGELRKASEVGRLCSDAIKFSIERDAENNENLLQARGDYFESVDYAIELAAQRAELYEQIVRTYEQAISDNGKNSYQSKSGHGSGY